MGLEPSRVGHLGQIWDVPESQEAQGHPKHMSRVSYSRWLQSHCPSHPGASGHPGISQTCPDCPTLDGSNPTVHPIPESQKAQGWDGRWAVCSETLGTCLGYVSWLPRTVGWNRQWDWIPLQWDTQDISWDVQDPMDEV